MFNTAFATLLLHERFTRFSLIGTVLTCTGAALIAIFGAIAEPAHNLHELLELLVRKKFVIWMVSTFIIVIGTLVLVRFLKYWSSHVRESHPHLKREHSPSASRPITQRRSPSMPLPHVVQLRTSRLRLLRGLAYALISGILSAHSLLVAKSAVELLVRTVVDHVNQFSSYQSWLILLALIFFALSQLYYLHQGLRLCSTSVLYPFVFCIYNIVAILDGLIYFHQTSRLSTLHGCLIALGTVVLLSGVLALSWRLDDAAPSEPQATPLGPGLGLVSSVSGDPGDSPRPALVPTDRRRSSTFKQPGSIPVDEESTPLLSDRRPSGRRPMFMIYPPPPETGNTQDLWAELDDSRESDNDVLTSLPRSTSPFLSASALQSQRRHHGSIPPSSCSPASITASDSFLGRPSYDRGEGSKDSGDGIQSHRLHFRPPRRSQTLKERTYKERRRSSAPSTGIVSGSRSSSAVSKTREPWSGTSQSTPPANPGGGDLAASRSASSDRRHVLEDRIRGRSCSATEAPRVVPSRWDMGGSVARWWQGQRREKEDAEGGRDREVSVGSKRR